MQKIIIIISVLAMLLLREECHGQGTVKYTAGISYGFGDPTYTPNGNVSKKYINLTTLRSHTYSGTAWVLDAQGIDVVSGCAVPAYTPGLGQSNIALNNCTLLQNGQGPELYVFDGISWIFINEKSTAPTYTAGDGIDITGTEITNTGDLSATNELQTISISGSDITLSNGGGTVTIPGGGVTWPLLAPTAETPVSYSFEDYPQTGMFSLDGGLNIGTLNGDGIENYIAIAAGSTTDDVGGSVNVYSGGSINADGGGFLLNAGGSTNANGGGFDMKSGDSETGNGGNYAVRSGNGNQGGNFSISSGDGISKSGGNFSMAAGDGVTGGGFTMNAGASSAGDGGAFGIYSGYGENGGSFSMYASDGSSNGGSFFMASGNGDLYGGSLDIVAGDGYGSPSTGGSININAGGGEEGGSIGITAGNTTGSGYKKVTITGGTGATFGAKGNVKIDYAIEYTPITSTLRDSNTPTAGKTIFCSNCTANDSSTGVLQTYNGSTWKNHW